MKTYNVIGVGEKNRSINASRFSLQQFWIDSENFRIDSELSFLSAVRWCWVFFRNTRILLASNSSHTYTTRTVCKIIFQKVQKGWSELQGHWRASLHRMRCVRRALCLMLHLKCAVSPIGIPYKCSTKSSFMWFGMQWTYIFKIWTSLTEGCFQFQMLTRTLFVYCSRMRLCVHDSV